MAEIQDFDPVDDNNTVRWPENMPMASVNNSGRADEGILSRWFRDSTAYAASSGTSTAYSVTPSRTISALSATTVIRWRAHAACSTNPTLTVSGFTGPIKKLFNTGLAAGDILSGQIVETHWDATNSWWQMTSPVASGTGYNTFGLKVGDVKLSLSSSPDSGFLRLKETAQTITQVAYPDLYAWLQAQGFPWGSGTGTANIPPAGGYLLRFGSTDASVDPSGPRTAGSTQTDQNKTHYHQINLNTAPAGTHNHNITVSGTGTTASSGLNPVGAAPGVTTTGVVADHIHNLAGNTIVDGGTEARPKNVAMFADILAVPGLVAAGLVGASGLSYVFSSATGGGDPGSGKIAFNNASISSATVMYVSETDSNGANLAGILGAFSSGSTIYLTKVGAPGNVISVVLSSSGTDVGTYRSYTLSSATSFGTVSNADNISAIILATTGPIGATGASGPVPIDYTWDTGTAAADPGSGKIRSSLGVFVGSFTLYINETDRLGNNLATFIQSWDDSTNTNKGILQIVDLTTPANRCYLTVTGTVADSGSYDSISVTYKSGVTSFAAGNVALMFIPYGDKGADGVGAGSVTSVDIAGGTTGLSATGGPITSSGTFTLTGTLVPANGGTGATTNYGAFDALSARGADIASASTINLDAATGNLVDVTGTTTITAITLASGRERTVRFTGALTLTHGASLLLPGAGSIITAAGDYAIFRGYAAGVVRCVIYSKASGLPVVGSGGAAIAENMSAGRLTLTSGTAVTTTDVTGATTVYFTPCNGDGIGLYDGVSTWTALAFTEKSIKLTDAQTGTRASAANGIITGLTDTSQLIVGMEASGTGIGASAVISTIDGPTQVTLSVNNSATGTATVTFKVPASKMLDIWAFNNSGTLKLEMTAWTNDTTRATAYTSVNGIECKSGATTRRLIGSVRTTTTAGQTDDSLLRRFVSNRNNQAPRQMVVNDATSSWSDWSTPSYRQARGSTANKVEFICCVPQLVSLSTAHTGSNTTISASLVAAIGIDSTTVDSAQVRQAAAIVSTAGTFNMRADYNGTPGVGYHYGAWLELSNPNGGTTTFYGTIAGSALCGVSGVLLG